MFQTRRAPCKPRKEATSNRSRIPPKQQPRNPLCVSVWCHSFNPFVFFSFKLIIVDIVLVCSSLSYSVFLRSGPLSFVVFHCLNFLNIVFILNILSNASGHSDSLMFSFALFNICVSSYFISLSRFFSFCCVVSSFPTPDIQPQV